MMLSEMPVGKLKCAQRPAQREPPLPPSGTLACMQFQHGLQRDVDQVTWPEVHTLWSATRSPVHIFVDLLQWFA